MILSIFPVENYFRYQNRDSNAVVSILDIRYGSLYLMLIYRNKFKTRVQRTGEVVKMSMHLNYRCDKIGFEQQSR